MSRFAQEAGDARHRDDRTAVGHRATRGFAQADERAAQVDVQHAIPFRGRQVEQRRAAAHSRAQDRDVETAEARDRLAHSGDDGVLVGDVDAERRVGGVSLGGRDRATTTRAPASRSCATHAAPIPLAPPVTIARAPWRSIGRRR